MKKKFVYSLITVLLLIMAWVIYLKLLPNLKYTVLIEDDTGGTVSVAARSHSISGDVNIPSYIKRHGKIYKVVSISDKAFFKCKKLESVFIPDSVESIGTNAFHECYNLKKAVLPNNIKDIADGLFCVCPNLSDFIIPENVTRIGVAAFGGKRCFYKYEIQKYSDTRKRNLYRTKRIFI